MSMIDNGPKASAARLAVSSVFSEARPANAISVQKVEYALKLLVDDGAAAMVRFYLKDEGITR